MGLHEKFGYPSKKQNKKYMQASVKKTLLAIMESYIYFHIVSSLKYVCLDELYDWKGSRDSNFKMLQIIYLSLKLSTVPAHIGQLGCQVWK